MTAVMEEKDVYLSSFAHCEKQWKDTDAPWLSRVRQAAIDRFAAVGFPTADDEEWRFTNPAPLTRAGLDFVPQTDGLELRVDGPLPTGAIVCSLADALRQHAGLLEKHLGRYADIEESAFTALNTAFLQEGVLIYVPRQVVLAQPIEVRWLAGRAAAPAVRHRRLLVVAEAHSQVRLVERFEGQADGGPYFTNAVTEAVLGENAHIDYCKVQQESPQAFHIHTLQIQQARASTFTAHSVTLGGRFVRNDLNATLGAEGCTCTLNGLYLGTGDQLIDNHTRIEHAHPHCASHELYKGILDGKAHGVFNGKIHVHIDAQKTDAKQTNQTLLLSDDATINTKPQLEIYADDVKCTHGATVGQLDAEALFYLRSRGLSKEAARGLLLYAFANDILSRIAIEPLRQELESQLVQAQQLPPVEDSEGVS